MSQRGPTILIVGGGASGTILAAHLLRSADQLLRVVIVEKRGVVGPGAAYSTTVPTHLLNVSALGMSAFAFDPEHFHQWLAGGGLAGDSQRPVYAPRAVYADYLRDIVREMERREAGSGRLRIVEAETTEIIPVTGGVELRLDNGTSLVGHVAVLATGHDEEPAAELAPAIRIGSATDIPVDPDASILILGTGLGMVDAWLTFEHRGHRGPVIAVSRRGLLPSRHRPSVPKRLDSADVPLGTDLSYFVRWLRDLVREEERAGGDWRDVVDGLRPFNQRIWRSWPASAKRRFVEHTKAWWDIHRHRMAPEIRDRVDSAVEVGKLRLLAGRVESVEALGPSGYAASILPRGGGDTIRLDVARLYDCTGIAKDVSAGSNPVVLQLIAEGVARPDPMRIGLDVTEGCALVDRHGKAHANLFAIGPLTRGAFFEIEAVPDIRAQCASLAGRLTGV